MTDQTNMTEEELVTKITDLHAEAMAKAKVFAAEYMKKIGIFILIDDPETGVSALVGNLDESHVLNILTAREARRMMNDGRAEVLAHVLGILANPRKFQMNPQDAPDDDLDGEDDTETEDEKDG